MRDSALIDVAAGPNSSRKALPLAPQCRRLHPGGRRQILAERLEELADEALRRPVGETDLAARPAHAHHLGRGLLLVGREHDAEGRDDRIEGVVGEGEGFRIGSAEIDLEPIGVGAFAAALEQRRYVVGRHYIAPAARRRERDIAIAGGDIEHHLARTEVERLAQRLADDLEGRADDCVVARRPGALLAGLQRAKIGLAGGRILTVD